MQKVSLAVLNFFAGLALLFNILSLATAAWIVSPFGSSGLWQACGAGSCVSLVNGVTIAWEYWLARIFSIGACATSLGGFVQGLRVLFQNQPLGAWITAKGLPGSFIASAIEGIVALSAFTAVTNVGFGVAWGYSYILGWCAVVFNIFLSIGAGVITRKFGETA